MFRRRANAAAAREIDSKYRFTSDVPYLVCAGAMQALRFIERPHLGRRSYEVLNRHTPAVGKANKRIAGDALAKIRHHRLLLVALLDRAIELRQCDHRHP